MLTIISPAKKLAFGPVDGHVPSTVPMDLDRSEQIMAVLRKKSVKAIKNLMDLSDDLAELNVKRYAEWTTELSGPQVRQALYAFRGDVYQGLDADTLSKEQVEFGSGHLRILSGLHGLLRPSDLIRPYRLEMGTPLAVKGKKNLYQFWGDRVTARLQADLDASGSDVLINLASDEYFKVVNAKKLKARIITPVFKDLKNGQYKSLFLYVKQARGMMAGHIIRNAVIDPEQLKNFNGGGYRYTEALSTPDIWVFTR